MVYFSTIMNVKRRRSHSAQHQFLTSYPVTVSSEEQEACHNLRGHKDTPFLFPAPLQSHPRALLTENSQGGTFLGCLSLLFYVTPLFGAPDKRQLFLGPQKHIYFLSLLCISYKGDEGLDKSVLRIMTDRVIICGRISYKRDEESSGI